MSSLIKRYFFNKCKIVDTIIINDTDPLFINQYKCGDPLLSTLFRIRFYSTGNCSVEIMPRGTRLVDNLLKSNKYSTNPTLFYDDFLLLLKQYLYGHHINSVMIRDILTTNIYELSKYIKNEK